MWLIPPIPSFRLRANKGVSTMTLREIMKKQLVPPQLIGLNQHSGYSTTQEELLSSEFWDGWMKCVSSVLGQWLPLGVLFAGVCVHKAFDQHPSLWPFVICAVVLWVLSFLPAFLQTRHQFTLHIPILKALSELRQQLGFGQEERLFPDLISTRSDAKLMSLVTAILANEAIMDDMTKSYETRTVASTEREKLNAEFDRLWQFFYGFNLARPKDQYFKAAKVTPSSAPVPEKA
jgi:hypothetical protein